MYQISFLFLLAFSSSVSTKSWTYSFAHASDTVSADDNSAPSFALSELILPVDPGIQKFAGGILTETASASLDFRSTGQHFPSDTVDQDFTISFWMYLATTPSVEQHLIKLDMANAATSYIIVAPSYIRLDCVAAQQVSFAPECKQMWTHLSVISTGGIFKLVLALGNGNFQETSGDVCSTGSRLDIITLETFKAIYRNVYVEDSALSHSALHSQIISFGCPTLNYGVQYCNALLYDISMLTEDQYIRDAVSGSQVGYLGSQNSEDSKDPARMGSMGLWFEPGTQVTIPSISFDSIFTVDLWVRHEHRPSQYQTLATFVQDTGSFYFAILGKQTQVQIVTNTENQIVADSSEDPAASAIDLEHKWKLYSFSVLSGVSLLKTTFQITDPENMTPLSFTAHFSSFQGSIKLGSDFNGQILRVAIAPLFTSSLKRFYPMNSCKPNIFFRQFSNLCELLSSSPINICNHGEFLESNQCKECPSICGECHDFDVNKCSKCSNGELAPSFNQCTCPTGQAFIESLNQCNSCKFYQLSERAKVPGCVINILSLAHSGSRKFTVTFDEPVSLLSHLNSDLHFSMVNTATDKVPSFEWTVSTPSQVLTTSLEIELDDYFVPETSQTYNFTFSILNPSVFTNTESLIFQPGVSISLTLEYSKYISSTEQSSQASARALGMLSLIVIFAVILVYILIMFKQRKTLIQLWNFISILQFLSSLPLFHLKFAKNTEAFFLRLIVVNLNYAGRSVFNPFGGVINENELNNEEPYASHFANYYIQDNYLILLWKTKWLVIILYSAIVLLNFLVHYFCIDENPPEDSNLLLYRRRQKPKRKICKFLIALFSVQAYFRFLMLTYLELCIFQMINMFYFTFHNSSQISANIFAILGALFMIGMPIYTFIYIFSRLRKGEDVLPLFTLGIKKQRNAGLKYGVVGFFMRRALYALSIVVVHNAPLVGLELTIFTTFVVLLIILSTLPYENRLVNLQTIVQEGCFLLCGILAIALHIATLSDSGRVALCWIIVVIVFLLILAELVFAIFQLLLMLKRNKTRVSQEKESVGSKETEMKQMHHQGVGMNTEDMVDISTDQIKKDFEEVRPKRNLRISMLRGNKPFKKYIKEEEEEASK